MKSERKNHDLNHDLTFYAHTIKCVCHSIRSMFRVLGLYNFVLHLLHLWKNKVVALFFCIKMQKQLGQKLNFDRALFTHKIVIHSYDRNLVSVLATETKIKFWYMYRSLYFCYLYRNFLHILFLKFFSCFLSIILNIS